MFDINISKQITTASVRSNLLLAFKKRNSKHSYDVTDRSSRYAACSILRLVKAQRILKQHKIEITHTIFVLSGHDRVGKKVTLFKRKQN